ncbi:MAG: DUF4440 domain-containing protein [Ferruginibacter sp.]
MNKLFTALLLTVIILCGCSGPEKKGLQGGNKNSEAMVKTDEEFSAMSAQKGMKTAFLEYIDSNGVMLRPDLQPIAGAEAIDYLLAVNDTGYTMTWKPTGSAVAVSGELGYTYGLYEIKPTSKDTVLYGTYVSIWKKQQDGKWKFVLESGNEGLGENE